MLYLFHDYELSEEEFSLTRAGQRIPLEPRALRVLLVLVAGHGSLCDKRSLLEAVWKDTFVEETTLTRAIALIRKQLRDDPRAPRFIETVPTRGYRFIAPTQVVHPSAVQRPAENASPSLPPAAEGAGETDGERHTDFASTDAAEVAVEAAAPPVLQHSARSPWAFAVALALIFAVGAASFFAVRGSHRAAGLSTGDLIVLGDFSNHTGDPVFDEALRQGVLVQLEQSTVLRLASDGSIRRTLQLMGLKGESRLTPEIAREVCQRVGGSIVLDGAVSRIGSHYLVGLQARRCSTGEEVDTEQVQIARKEDALSGLDRIAGRFRARIGESAGSIRERDVPLAEATTPSLDALRHFSQGIRAFNARGSAAAIPFFQRAVEVDPRFATAYVWMGRMYADLGQETLATESTKRAYELRDRASDRERFSIDVSYDLLVTGNLEKARAACDAWVQMYPRDVYARALRSGMIYPAFGQHERALQDARESIAVDPDFVAGYRNAAMNLIALNRLDEADEVLARAERQKVFLPSFITDRYRIAFLRHDRAGMERALLASPRNPWLQYFHAATLAQAGQLTQARAMQEQALRLSRHGLRQEIEAQLLVTSAFTDLHYGFSRDAVAKVHDALHLTHGRQVEAAGALVLAMAGSLPEASALVATLRSRYPEDTVLRYDYLPAAEAAIALKRRQPQHALDLLEEASQFELSVPLYPVFLRGEAYLALNRPADAAAEFEKIVSHPGLVLNDPLYNVAQMWLGHSLRIGSRPGQPRAVVHSIESRWQVADERFPVLQQVRQASSAR